jgi:flagellin
MKQMRINNNISAVNAYRTNTETMKKIGKSTEKLTSGLRINRAGDDSAGLAISEKMRGQIKGLEKSTRNSQDAVSLIQTAEGALNETHTMLQRMRELAVQSANETNTDSDREQLQLEMNRLRQDVDRISADTEFNKKRLLTGEFAESGLIFQVGANEGQTVNLKFNDMGAEALGISGVEEEYNSATNEYETKVSKDKAVNISDSKSAEKAITTINNAIEQVSDERSRYGAMQNRMEHTIKNLDLFKENLQASESRIRDANMAMEIVSNSKDKIISQSGNSMLAQANAKPQSVLQILG